MAWAEATSARLGCLLRRIDRHHCLRFGKLILPHFFRRFRLGQRVLKVAGIDLHQELTLLYLLIVVNEATNDRACNSRADGYGMRVNKCIVCPLV